MKELIVSEMAYNGGMFPKIPGRVSGQDTLLVNSQGIARKVDDKLTTKDIRLGKYNKIVRISTVPNSLDILLKAVSKNKPYEFAITIGVEYHVKDSVVFYMNSELHDVSNSIGTALSRIINPIAKQYELTDDCIDDALLSKLSEHEYSLAALGIIYFVRSADAEPSENATIFIKQMSDATLNVRVEQHKAVEAGKLTARNMESAIMTKVASGEMDMKTALETLSNSNRTDGLNKIEDIERLIGFVQNLLKNNLITDFEASQHINVLLKNLPANISNIKTLTDTSSQPSNEEDKNSDTTLEALFSDENQGDMNEQ